MALWNRLTAFVTGGAVATASADALAPEFEVLKQTAWANEPHKVLDPHTAAELRARQPVDGIPGIDPEGVNFADDAARTGIGSKRFDLLTELARTEPGLGELIRLRRRGMETNDAQGITDPELTLALRRSGYTADHVSALRSLVFERLTPQQIALGIVRSILPDKNLLAEQLDHSPGNVKRYEQSKIDPVAEAQDAGIDSERLRIMVGEIGLPMAAGEAAEAYFRGIITESDYNAAISEGDTRPEWAAAILEHAREIPTAGQFVAGYVRSLYDVKTFHAEAARHGMSTGDADLLFAITRQIPSVADYINAELRGWITTAERNAGIARHGMTPAEGDLLYDRSGRPAAPGQMATAAARGNTGPDGRPMDREQFLKGIRQSDIRPEWGEMLWESRFLYPPLFQITRLVQAGAITPETAKDWAVKDRYPPEVVDPLYAYWSGLTGGTTATWASKAQSQFWTTLHRSYLNGETGEQEARDALAAMQVPADQIGQVITLWDYERDTWRKQLTPAQIKKAYQKLVINPATAAPWTHQDAIDALLARGYPYNDAETFLST
jgi:hypothetical protein